MAGEEYRTKIAIEIDDDATGHQSFKFHSADAGFNLNDLAVGETRMLTGESGNTAQVTRTEDGFELDVDGRKIDLGDLNDFGGAHDEHEIEHQKTIRMIKTDNSSAVTVISDKAIDEATRQRIREALELQDGDVLFIDSTEMEAAGAHQAHKRREVRVIKKKEDTTDL